MTSSSNADEPPSAKGSLKLSAASLAAAAVVFIIGVSTPWFGDASGGGGVAEAVSFAPLVLAEELETPTIKSYPEEFAKALSPVTTVRGVWRTRETRTDGSFLPLEEGKAGSRTRGICRGRLSFKGFVGAGKGTLEYRACGDREGKGRWLTKPKNVVNGRITLSARWKVNFLDGTSLLYRGDVVQDPEETPLSFDASGSAAKGGPAFQRPDAHIRGEVLLPTTNIQGTLSEKQIGEFEADLIELPSDDDRM